MNLSSWDFLWHSFLRKGAAQRNEELISQFSLTQLNKRHRSSISLRRQSRSFPQLHLGRRSSRRDKSSNSGSFSMITRRSTSCPASSEALPTASISVKNSNTSTLCGSSRFTPSPKKNHPPFLPGRISLSILCWSTLNRTPSFLLARWHLKQSLPHAPLTSGQLLRLVATCQQDFLHWLPLQFHQSFTIRDVFPGTITNTKLGSCELQRMDVPTRYNLQSFSKNPLSPQKKALLCKERGMPQWA